MYYSQYGEDFLLNRVFAGRGTGFFVEVGCIDGRRFSNSLFFEEKGWRGVCVEAHRDYIEALKRNRPGSRVVHCAVGDRDEDLVTFYANARGSLSTLDSGREEDFRASYGEYFTGFEEQRVRKRTLNAVFEECRVPRIDFLSIDVEGTEADVLRGLSLERFGPRVMVVEADSQEEYEELEGLLKPAGYAWIVRYGRNAFFCRERALWKKIYDRNFGTVELLHTQHPLDLSGDERRACAVDTRTSAGTGRLRRAAASFRHRLKALVSSR